MVPALIRNFPVDSHTSPRENFQNPAGWRPFGELVTPARRKRRSAMKSQFQSPFRSRLRQLARSLREKSTLARLKIKNPTMNPAPITRIKGWLNAHDLMRPKGRR
jgi:hypothetical protein